MKKEDGLEETKSQMRKGMIEFFTLLIIARGEAYASDILKELKLSDLLVVEGTLYPLLSRLASDGLLEYSWKESPSGPPRKYYTLTSAGKEKLKALKTTWKSLRDSIETLLEPTLKKLS